MRHLHDSDGLHGDSSPLERQRAAASAPVCGQYLPHRPSASATNSGVFRASQLF
jgi:hypothetical protein